APVPDAEQNTEAAPAADAPPKKKTRRGSRGGRGRKKPATAAVSTNGAVEAETVEPRRPTIHVPAADVSQTGAVSQNGDEPEATPKKKTRRGSRGGRRRRKPAATTTTEQRSDES